MSDGEKRKEKEEEKRRKLYMAEDRKCACLFPYVLLPAVDVTNRHAYKRQSLYVGRQSHLDTLLCRLLVNAPYPLLLSGLIFILLCCLKDNTWTERAVTVPARKIICLSRVTQNNRIPAQGSVL